MHEGPTVPVQYTCHACGITDRVVPIRERGRVEDLKGWIYDVQVAVGNDHGAQSPACQCREVDLKIPLPKKENFFVGEARRQ